METQSEGTAELPTHTTRHGTQRSTQVGSKMKHNPQRNGDKSSRVGQGRWRNPRRQRVESGAPVRGRKARVAEDGDRRLFSSYDSSAGSEVGSRANRTASSARIRAGNSSASHGTLDAEAAFVPLPFPQQEYVSIRLTCDQQEGNETVGEEEDEGTTSRRGVAYLPSSSANRKKYSPFVQCRWDGPRTRGGG